MLTDEAYRGLVVNLANVKVNLIRRALASWLGVWHRVRGTEDCLALAAPTR